MGWSDIVPGARYGEPELRAAVVEFVRGLDLHGLTLAGESLGAALALSASIDLRGRVSRVVAFNSYDYPSGLERGNWLARLIITSVRLPVLGPVFACRRTSCSSSCEAAAARASRGWLDRSLEAFIHARHRYADVSAPVTLVYSDRDWSRVAERDQVANSLAAVERITLPRTGHFSSLERPDDVARILLLGARADGI